MTLYHQETELNLLVQCLSLLENKRFIDVGAERGGFVQVLVENGAEAVYAVEPYPPSAALLRERFGSQPTVHILEMALGAREETVTLHIVKDKTGDDNDSLHSIVPVTETPMLQPAGEVSVQCRTLDGLLTEGAIPSEVGILKIDAERSDFAVLQGMGSLVSAVVMIEFWNDLPQTVGDTPYQVSDVIAFMVARGYTNYVLVKRYDEFEALQMNAPFTRPGEWGNIIFIHDGSFAQLSAVIYSAVQQAQAQLVDKALLYRSECEKRMVVIQEQQVAIIEQVRVMGQLAENERTLTTMLKRTTTNPH